MIKQLKLEVKNRATATLTPPQGDPLVVQSDDPNNDADMMMEIV